MIRSSLSALGIAFALLVFVGVASAQADEICQEFGETPTRELGKDNRLVPYVFGRISVNGVSAGVKPPRVTAIYSDSLQPAKRQLIGKSGNYCFQKRGTSGTLVIEVDGVEVLRKPVSDISNMRQREDFEVYPPQAQRTQPGMLTAKSSRPPNDKTADLYKKAAEAESEKHFDKAVNYVKEIISTDPEDFIAWAKLGSLYLGLNSIAEAEKAFKTSLGIKSDYAPALLNLGIIKAVQKQNAEAIELFKQAVTSDPTYAPAYRYLGEAYLQNRQGTLGLAALDKALELDPVGMAECHLLKARLYDLAGAKNLATREYKQFLAKVQDHPDKKIFQKYIKDNPE